MESNKAFITDTLFQMQSSNQEWRSKEQSSNQEWRSKELANIRASSTKKSAVRDAIFMDSVTKGTRPPTSAVKLVPLDLSSAGGAGSDNNDDDTYNMDDEDDMDNDEDDDSISIDSVSA